MRVIDLISQSFGLFARAIHPGVRVRASLTDLTLGRAISTSSQALTGASMLKLPIGYDNFGEIKQNKLDLVDKSLFIRDVLDDTAKVSVITRPRRFGKTLNLSMLHHFLAPEVRGLSTRGLFDDLKIAQAGQQYMQHHGKYPVISVSFKDVRDHKFKVAYDNLSKLVGDIYSQHEFLLSSPKLTARDKWAFEAMMSQNPPEAFLRDSLKDLCRYMAYYYGVSPWLLVDEYDTPIQSSYEHGYYDQMINLMRGVLGGALKGNDFLHRAVVTGILRVAKESLFSGVNNLKVYSLLHPRYSQHFGFTEEEVNDLLEKSHLSHLAKEVRVWYNGYQMGETVIYNPWSIVSCIQDGGRLQPYWVNTSSNELIRSLLISSGSDFKQQFDLLLQNKPMEQFIDENTVFGDLDKGPTAVWSLFLMSGYLKTVSHRRDEDGRIYYRLAFPNQEIRLLYRDMIERWLANGRGIEWYNQFIHRLLACQPKRFEYDLRTLMEQTVSIHDVAKTSENFYHGLMLGFTASLQGDKRYELISNRESGYGRLDYLIFSRDPKKPSVLMEFKKVEPPKDETQLTEKLEAEAKKALIQIDRRGYLAEAKQRGSEKVLKIGLAFCGKQFVLCPEAIGFNLEPDEETLFQKHYDGPESKSGG